MTRTFTCRQCYAVLRTAATHVGTDTISDWWNKVGNRCQNCRDRTTEPRPGLYHRAGKDTERQAANSIANISGKLRQQALDHLKHHPEGLTDDEGGRLMGGDRLTFGRRRLELADSGYVKDSGTRRATPTGRSAIVWVITDKGLAE